MLVHFINEEADHERLLLLLHTARSLACITTETPPLSKQLVDYGILSPLKRILSSVNHHKIQVHANTTNILSAFSLNQSGAC